MITGKSNLIVIGDSLSITPNPDLCWVSNAKSFLPEWEITNLAVGGKMLAQMLAEFPTGAALHLNPLACRNVLFILGGTNDLGSYTGPQIFGIHQELAGLALSIGFTVAPCTVPGNGNVIDMTETNRIDFNNLLRAKYPPRVLVDLASPAYRFANKTDGMDARWFALVDRVHPTQEAATEWAKIIIPHILSVPFNYNTLATENNRNTITLPAIIGVAEVVQPIE